MSYCGSTTLLSYEDSQTRGSVLRCRCWGCDDCLPGRLAELKKLALAGHADKFLTLTARASSYPTPEAQAQALVKAWRALRQWLIRNGWAETLPYLAVFEEHKSGRPHLHVLYRGPFIPQKILSRRMALLCDGPNVWITHIRKQSAAGRYVAKYVSKGPARYDGCKRYWRSRDFVVDPDAITKKTKSTVTTWWRAREHVWDEAIRWEGAGWIVVEESPGSWVASPTDRATWPRDCGLDPPPGAPAKQEVKL